VDGKPDSVWCCRTGSSSFCGFSWEKTTWYSAWVWFGLVGLDFCPKQKWEHKGPRLLGLLLPQTFFDLLGLYGPTVMMVGDKAQHFTWFLFLFSLFGLVVRRARKSPWPWLMRIWKPIGPWWHHRVFCYRNEWIHSQVRQLTTVRG